MVLSFSWMSSNCVFCDKSCDISVYATIHISNVDEHTLKYIARHALFSFVLSKEKHISNWNFEKLFRLLVFPKRIRSYFAIKFVQIIISFWSDSTTNDILSDIFIVGAISHKECNPAMRGWKGMNRYTLFIETLVTCSVRGNEIRHYKRWEILWWRNR